MTPFALTASINVMALGVAASAALAVLYILCWLAAVILPDAGLPHGWINLFTKAPVSSVRARRRDLEPRYRLGDRVGSSADLQQDQVTFSAAVGNFPAVWTVAGGQRLR
jgi:hypothetical protein